MIPVAILGYGYMGEIRRRVVEAHPDLKLIQICETDPSRVPASPSIEVTRDPKAILDGPAKLVFVCTPNNLIPELAIECMKRGKHVFCEKPPGRSLQDVIDIRAQESKSPGVKLMFGFNHRYHPGIQRSKKIIQSGELGKLLWIRGIYGKSGGKNFPKSWRNQREVSGGGILLDQGIHMLDLFNYFCPGFTEVKAFTSTAYWQFDLEDNAFVILKNAQGQNAMLHSSATFWKHKFQIEIGLEKGYLTVQGLLSKSGSYGPETLTVGRRAFEDETDAVGNPSETVTMFDRDLSWELEVRHIAECILEDKPVTESNSTDALKVMEIVDRAYRDSGNGS